MIPRRTEDIEHDTPMMSLAGVCGEVVEFLKRPVPPGQRGPCGARGPRRHGLWLCESATAATLPSPAGIPYVRRKCRSSSSRLKMTAAGRP